MNQRAKPLRRHLDLDDVGSTNAVALDAARSGDPGCLWITASRQSSGRGRRGRPWVSEIGNLYATLLLLDPAAPEDIMNLPLVAALGVRNGLSQLESSRSARFRIKWPNDILLNGKKLAGILLESERLRDGRLAVVIGCGVNIEHLPDATPYPITGLRQEGIGATVTEAFLAVADGIEASLALWQRGRNFAAVRTAWLEHAAGLGESCTVNLPQGALEGRFAGLDGSGRMLLEDRDGRHRAISAGDLFLLGRSMQEDGREELDAVSERRNQYDGRPLTPETMDETAESASERKVTTH